MISKMQAIQNLVPGAEVSIAIGNGEVTWLNPPVAPVSEDQIRQEQQRLQEAYDWYEYRRNRAREYPSIEEQLDALYHAGVFPPEMAEKIRAVKQKYPQPVMSKEEWLQRQIASPPEPAQQIPTLPEPIGTPTPRLTVAEWLAQEQQITKDQWLEQQKNSVETQHMTREQWLAQQATIRN